MGDAGWKPPPPGTQLGLDDQWILIQEKTFTNWINEQLKVSGRAIQNIATDLCDGVHLVALVEALQFRKIGKVYTKATSKIQMLQNVSLALKAVTDDHVKLVNVGKFTLNFTTTTDQNRDIVSMQWHDVALTLTSVSERRHAIASTLTS